MTRLFDDFIAEQLQDEEFAAMYLNEAMGDEDPNVFLIALMDYLNAKGLNKSEVAKQAGVTRESLYKSLSKKGNPHFQTVRALLQSSGFEIRIDRVTKARSHDKTNKPKKAYG